MIKRLTLLLLAAMIMTDVVADTHHKAFRNPVNGNTIDKVVTDRGGITETTLLSEDFSKFTAGTDTEPDYVRLDDADGNISDEYFNTPGWKGNEVYQAGGCAYIGFSEEYQETGIIITPLINTSGAIYINCRMRTVDPAGDIVGYNIVDENLELLDANVDFFKVTNEWTNVSWFTSAGTENSYIYIYSYSKNVFIDDIEIVSVQLPTPTLLEETNISKNSFTANWEAVENADSYIFKLTAEHTANADETFYYANTGFDNVASNGTLANPEIDNTVMEATVENWHIFMPALINEAIGYTGKYASSEVFGAITSPVLDLSSDNGKIKFSFKAHADLNETLIVSLITSEYGYYDVADQKNIIVEKEGWNEYSVEFNNGTDDAYIEITSFGWGDVFFDDVKLSQSIKAGEKKTLVVEELEVEDTHHKANIDNAFLNDILSYQVASRKNVYSINNNIIGTIDSKFTEAKIVDLVSEEIALEMISIGEGDINTYYAPISNYGASSGYSISQQIYTKDEINMESGNIIGISFRNKNGNANTRDITVFMSNTVQDSYRDSHDWVLIDESQIVYDGEFTFGTQDEWTTIELQNPFTYSGDNIAISIYDASNNSLGYSAYDSFYAHATDTLRGLYKTASSKINIYSIEEELYCYELKTSVYTTPANQYYVNDIMMEFCASDIVGPNVPQNLSANAIDQTSVSLSWTSAKNATSYNVYRGTEKLANVTTTYYLVEGLEPNTEYCFTIAAVNSNSESEKSAEACAKTLKEEQIDAPKNLEAWAPEFEAGVISLKWDIVAAASSYNIYRDNELLVNVKENTYKDTTTYDLNKEYCYKVTAVSASGIESEESNESCAQPLACVGLEELSSSINIYPNPVNDMLYIKTDFEIEDVVVYDVFGRQQDNRTTRQQDNVTIDVSKLDAGVYFVKMRTTEGEIVKRIVKRN
ncbi:MAG: T9SS type A sorting domain-containing protein [Bacteroidales bacterium]|nr:T9SS type A sorting domain-containing protein [Bacteroidales bacterium]